MGRSRSGATDFSRSKRGAERAIAASGAPFVILRPGFVIAPNAYGARVALPVVTAKQTPLTRRIAAAFTHTVPTRHDFLP